jgi:hypothetical protein
MQQKNVIKSVKEYNNYDIIIRSKIGNDIVIKIKEDPHFGDINIKTTQKITNINYFNGDMNEITFICTSLFYFKLLLVQKNIPITQMYIAEHLRQGFGEQLRNFTPLGEYTNNENPAIFYGIWSEKDMTVLKNNKSLKVIIWSGGDINIEKYRTEAVNRRVLNNITEIKNLTKVVHVSKSNFISKSLDKLNFTYIEVPYIGLNFNMFRSAKKGKSIYIYTSPTNQEYYGSKYYEKIVEKYNKINFIFTCCKQTSEYLIRNNIKTKHNIKYYEKNYLVNKIYPQCFLALRLTIHDGIANTVQELGLMGIKSVHNGNGPSCLNYETFEDICAHIDNEIKTVGKKDIILASKVKKYLTLDPKFYNTVYYRFDRLKLVQISKNICNVNTVMLDKLKLVETVRTEKISKYSNYEIILLSQNKINTIEILEDNDFGILAINRSYYILNYFNDVLDNITIKIISESYTNIQISNKNIEIDQIYIAQHLDHFRDDLLTSYPNLKNYYNDLLPSIYYGIWSPKDLEMLRKNKSLKIIIWTGGDIYIDAPENHLRKHIQNNFNKIKNLTKIVHIAISNFIQSDLASLQIKHLRVPFMGIKMDKYKPITKGSSIYIYTSPVLGNKYGEELYSKIVQKYSHINFIFTCSKGSMNVMDKQKNTYNIKYYDKDELVEKIYPQCFIGLRLTKHDGLAGTVQELGTLGIKSIHNGDSPSCLNYNNFEDICEYIDNEIKNIGTKDVELSNHVKNYLTIDKDFFDTKYFNVFVNDPHNQFVVSYYKDFAYEHSFDVKKNCNYKITIETKIGSILNIAEDKYFGNYYLVNGKNIFNYYNDNNTVITFLTRCSCIISVTENDFRIKQIYISERLRRAFEYDLLKTHPLEEYNNDYEPVIFYGLWSKEDLSVFQKNKSLKIIIWTGGDINYSIMCAKETGDKVLENINIIRTSPKVKHISISSFISASLSRLGIKYKEVPFMGIDFDYFKPTIKGNSIYVYTTVGEPKHYGSDLYNKVKEKYTDINFIFTWWINSQEYSEKTKYQNKNSMKYYEKKELVEKIYPQCFVGLRLTPHDGLSATVQELGLMGIKCIHNGNSPSSLNYDTFEDICQHIDTEQKKIGTLDEELALQVKNYLTIDPNFFMTSFYNF